MYSYTPTRNDFLGTFPAFYIKSNREQLRHAPKEFYLGWTLNILLSFALPFIWLPFWAITLTVSFLAFKYEHLKALRAQHRAQRRLN